MIEQFTDWLYVKWLELRRVPRVVACAFRGHSPRELPGFGFIRTISCDWPSGENPRDESYSERSNTVVCERCGATLAHAVTKRTIKDNLREPWR